MKRIAMAIVAGTLSLSALALGAKPANAAELAPVARKVGYREGRDRREVRRDRFHHERARDFRERRFESRRGCY